MGGWHGWELDGDIWGTGRRRVSPGLAGTWSGFEGLLKGIIFRPANALRPSMQSLMRGDVELYFDCKSRDSPLAELSAGSEHAHSVSQQEL